MSPANSQLGLWPFLQAWLTTPLSQLMCQCYTRHKKRSMMAEWALNMPVIEVLQQSAFKCTAIHWLAQKNRYPWKNQTSWRTCIRLSYKKNTFYLTKTLKNAGVSLYSRRLNDYLSYQICAWIIVYDPKRAIQIILYGFIQCEKYFEEKRKMFSFSRSAFIFLHWRRLH